jgi:hypothetical protein
MLQCATNESVLRLDKTALEAEASLVQKIYTEEQCHDNLFAYLLKAFSDPSQSSLRIQVSFFLITVYMHDLLITCLY